MPLAALMGATAPQLISGCWLLLSVHSLNQLHCQMRGHANELSQRIAASSSAADLRGCSCRGLLPLAAT